MLGLYGLYRLICILDEFNAIKLPKISNSWIKQEVLHIYKLRKIKALRELLTGFQIKVRNQNKCFVIFQLKHTLYSKESSQNLFD